MPPAPGVLAEATRQGYHQLTQNMCERPIQGQLSYFSDQMHESDQIYPCLLYTSDAADDPPVV